MGRSVLWNYRLACGFKTFTVCARVALRECRSIVHAVHALPISNLPLYVKGVSWTHIRINLFAVINILQRQFFRYKLYVPAAALWHTSQLAN